MSCEESQWQKATAGQRTSGGASATEMTCTLRCFDVILVGVAVFVLPRALGTPGWLEALIQVQVRVLEQPKLRLVERYRRRPS